MLQIFRLVVFTFPLRLMPPEFFFVPCPVCFPSTPAASYPRPRGCNGLVLRQIIGLIRCVAGGKYVAF